MLKAFVFAALSIALGSAAAEDKCITDNIYYNYSTTTVCIKKIESTRGCVNRNPDSPVDHIEATCPDGRKWKLSCYRGGNCNLNDYELCYGLSQWGVGEHCRQKVPSNDGVEEKKNSDTKVNSYGGSQTMTITLKDGKVIEVPPIPASFGS